MATLSLLPGMRHDLGQPPRGGLDRLDGIDLDLGGRCRDSLGPGQLPQDYKIGAEELLGRL